MVLVRSMRLSDSLAAVAVKVLHLLPVVEEIFEASPNFLEPMSQAVPPSEVVEEDPVPLTSVSRIPDSHGSAPEKIPWLESGWRWLRSTVEAVKPTPQLIIPPLFLHVIAASLNGNVLNQLIILAVCRSLPLPSPDAGGVSEADNASKWLLAAYSPPLTQREFWYSSSNMTMLAALPTYAECVVRPDVQAAAAMFSQMQTLAHDIPAFLLVPLMGKLVDTLGRKAMMLLPLSASILNAVAVLLIAWADVGLWLLVAVRFASGFLGSYSILTMAVYAFIADTTAPAARTRTFLTLDISSFLAFMFGPFIGGHRFKNFGLLTVFVTVLVLNILVFTFFLLVLPESLKGSARGVSRSENILDSDVPEPQLRATLSISTAWSMFLQSWIGSLDILSVSSGSSLYILALVTAVSSLGSSGYQYCFYYYPAQKFGWDAYDFGFYSMAKSSCRMVYLTVVMPLLLKQFCSGQDLVQKTRSELSLVRWVPCTIRAVSLCDQTLESRVGYLLGAVGLLCHTFATESWMMFPLIVVYTGITISGPVKRGIISRAVPASSQGALFAALELLAGGTGLISELLIPSLYRILVKRDKPQYIFVVEALFLIAALCLTAYLKSRELVGISEEEEGANDIDAERDALLPAMTASIRSLRQDARRSISMRRRSGAFVPSLNASHAWSDNLGDEESQASVVQDSVVEELGGSEEEQRGALRRMSQWLNEFVDSDALDHAVDEVSREFNV
ncbi:major facilitator superfamily domain-containing protein [Chytriomyces sp. MP71]|nr:major facilitator superfamily domain-containing protein [Chytriomyces sp. MP71]